MQVIHVQIMIDYDFGWHVNREPNYYYYHLQASTKVQLIFFSQLTTRSPELIQEFPLGHSQRHISSEDGNLRRPKYIPCRILLGLSADTLFGGV